MKSSFTTPYKPSYITRVNLFWKMDERYQFTPQQTRVYFYLLKVANNLDWIAEFEHADQRAAVNCGLSLPCFKAARKKLAETGLIRYIPGGNGYGQKTKYVMLGCTECDYQPKAKCEEKCRRTPLVEKHPAPVEEVAVATLVTPELGETSLTPNPATLYKENRQEKKTSSATPKEGDPFLNIPPVPADGKKRNTSGLIENLERFRASAWEIREVLRKSNFGEIGHAVWSAIYEIKQAAGAIKSPLRFILSRISADNSPLMA